MASAPVAGPAVLRGYRRSWLRGDLIAGVTVAAYLVPQVSRPVIVGLPDRRRVHHDRRAARPAHWRAGHRETFIAQVVSFAGRLAQVNLGDVIIIAAAVLAFLFIAQSRWPRLPGPLTAVLLSTAACAIFGLGRHGVALVGHIPQGLPAPRLPVMSLRDVQELMLPALGVLLVAFSDDVLTARAFERGGEVIDANQELLALGVSNAGAGLLRGFPVSSSGSRTAIAMSAGRTPRRIRWPHWSRSSASCCSRARCSHRSRWPHSALSSSTPPCG